MPSSSKPKRIKDLPLTSQPREKLFIGGRENLTNAELLALLFGTGTAGKNVVKLSETFLKQYPLEKLEKASPTEWTKFPGIGRSKATRLAAAIELGERMFSPKTITKTLILSTVAAVAELKSYADKRQEYLIALYLNARHELIQKEILGIGTLNAMQIEPKEVFRPALSTPCAGLIVAHNHPSGDPQPSDNDIAFTKRLFDAGEIMGIPLLDHIILARSTYYSFRDAEE